MGCACNSRIDEAQWRCSVTVRKMRKRGKNSAETNEELTEALIWMAKVGVSGLVSASVGVSPPQFLSQKSS